MILLQLQTKTSKFFYFLFFFVFCFLSDLNEIKFIFFVKKFQGEYRGENLLSEILVGHRDTSITVKTHVRFDAFTIPPHGQIRLVPNKYKALRRN